MAATFTETKTPSTLHQKLESIIAASTVASLTVGMLEAEGNKSKEVESARKLLRTVGSLGDVAADCLDDESVQEMIVESALAALEGVLTLLARAVEG